jgi:desulfoferrodoxin
MKQKEKMMARASFRGVYKCELCGNVVEMLHPGGGELVCCGQPMTLLEEKSADSSTEKHVPVIEKNRQGLQGYGGKYSSSHDRGTLHSMDRTVGRWKSL